MKHFDPNSPNSWYAVGALAALAVVITYFWVMHDVDRLYSIYLSDQQHKCEARNGVYARTWTPHGDTYQCMMGERKP